MRISSNARHYVYLDFLRVFAAFLVIYNHTAGFHYYLNHDNDRIKVLLTIALSVCTKINVPLFFMLSGALLLGKDESYPSLFTKRILRIVCVLVCASYFTFCFSYRTPLDLKRFFTLLFHGYIAREYWFIYTYLGFLAALPFLGSIAKHITYKEILLIFSLRLIAVLINFSEYVTTKILWREFVLLTDYFSAPFATIDFIFYPVVGYYLANVLPTEKIRARHVVCLVSSCIAGIIITTLITYHQGINEAFTQDYISELAFCFAAAAFIISRLLYEKLKPASCSSFKKLITAVAPLTLGVYLLDPVFRKMVFYNKVYEKISDSLIIVPYSILYCFISLSVLSFVTYLLKKIPGIKRIL